MGWVSEAEKRRVEHALRYLRALIPAARLKLEETYGEGWPKTLKTERRLTREPSLSDTRSFLNLFLKHGERGPALEFDLISHWSARRLLTIANTVRHDKSDDWRAGDDHRAYTLARSFVLLAGLERKRVHAAIIGRHQEIFELEQGQIRHRWWPSDASGSRQWSLWASMQTASAGVVDIAAVGQTDRLDLFLLTIDGQIETRTYRHERGWTDWKPLAEGGERVIGPISAVSLEPGHSEIFAVGEKSQLVHRWAFNDEWTAWHDLNDDEDTPSEVISSHALSHLSNFQCSDRLEAGQVLRRNQSLISKSGRFKLTLHDDGHLILWDTSEVIWRSNTADSGADRLDFQHDGNLVLYTSSMNSVWNSGTYGKPSQCFIVQDDGNAVIYSTSQEGLWHTDTWIRT